MRVQPTVRLGWKDREGMKRRDGCREGRVEKRMKGWKEKGLEEGRRDGGKVNGKRERWMKEEWKEE